MPRKKKTWVEIELSQDHLKAALDPYLKALSLIDDNQEVAAVYSSIKYYDDGDDVSCILIRLERNVE